MDTKHTPATWKQCAAVLTDRGMVYGINAWADVEGFNRPQDCRIAEVFSVEANAKLIAAAPDLLEALLDARYALYGNGPGNPKIDAAITKATK